MSSGLLVVLVVVAFVTVLVVAYLLDKKRHERLLQWCRNRGWAYAAEDRSLVDRWSGSPFGQGDRRRARDVISGTEGGRPFVAFDYSYDTHSDDGKGNRTTTTHHYAVCALALPAYLPSLQVAPEGAFRRLAGAMGLARDIDLESEDFNRRFTVQATDPKFASDVLSPRTMEYLLSVPAVAWRIEGTSILRWESGRLDPADVVEATAVLNQVTSGIPTFVWKDHGYDPRP